MMRRVLHPLLVALAFIASGIAWARLPERAPVHWNLSGEVDRYGNRLELALLAPVVMLLVWGLMRVLPKLDPRRANFAKMEGTYELVITLALLALLTIHIAVLAAAMGYDVPMDTVVPVLVGTMFIAVGNILPRARPNWWFGVRTPWTLSNDRVWMRTHRFAGYAFVLAGIAFLAMVFIEAPWARITLFGAIIAGALTPLVYSYIAWRQESSGGSST